MDWVPQPPTRTQKYSPQQVPRRGFTHESLPRSSIGDFMNDSKTMFAYETISEHFSMAFGLSRLHRVTQQPHRRQANPGPSHCPPRAKQGGQPGTRRQGYASAYGIACTIASHFFLWLLVVTWHIKHLIVHIVSVGLRNTKWLAIQAALQLDQSRRSRCTSLGRI